MEARRQQVMQKKVDEEKTREEKKVKEESERRKREREKEDTTEKRALKLPGKKVCVSAVKLIRMILSDSISVTAARRRSDKEKKAC